MTEWETNILCETPPGRIQIEVGVQSTHKKTLDAINDITIGRTFKRQFVQLLRRDAHMFIWI